jgi:hypothetical protein
MNDLKCCYCNTIFKTNSALNNHKNKAKYCLILRGKIEQKKENKCDFCGKRLSSKKYLEIHMKKCNIIVEKEDFKCKYCNKILSTKQMLEYHVNSCNVKKEKELKQKDEELKQKDRLNFELKTENEYYKKQEENYKEQIKDLQNKLERILNKAIERPTTTNNNTVNNKFELNTFPSQKEIDRKIESQFNDKYILDGMKGIAQFVFDHIVKLEDGSMAYACYDTSRQIFKYKDEHGNEIKDPKAVKLRKMIKPGLLRQSKTLLDYFNDECDYLEKRKDNGQDIDGKEYNIMNTLREKAFEVGCEILSIEDTNKFSNELANLSCV